MAEEKFWQTLTLQKLNGKILIDGQCLSQCTCQYCNALKTFDGINFDYPTGNRQKHQNPTVKILYYICTIKSTVHVAPSSLCGRLAVIDHTYIHI